MAKDKVEVVMERLVGEWADWWLQLRVGGHCFDGVVYDFKPTQVANRLAKILGCSVRVEE